MKYPISPVCESELIAAARVGAGRTTPLTADDDASVVVSDASPCLAGPDPGTAAPWHLLALYLPHHHHLWTPAGQGET